jgi:uncharacterized protein YbjT (DUF2867 family)
MKKALLFGASGLVGSYLLQELLNNDAYGQVTIVVRRTLNIQHQKLITIAGDYATLPGLKEELVADEIFIALGTTKKKTPDKKEYYQIDHDYPVLAASLAKENGATAVFIVSAIGADAGSRIFYTRTKGEMERDIIALNYNHTHIFRPSLIKGERKENRPLEKVFMKIWPAVDLLLAGERLKKYKGIQAHDIAKAMIAAAQQPSAKLNIYYWQQMKALADAFKR